MTKHLSPEEIEAIQIAWEESDVFRDDFPGWLKMVIWIGLGALSWAIPIMAIYLVWRAV